METQRQGIALLTALCVVIATLLIVQLWLVAGSLDALLGGAIGTLTPAAVVSLLLFIVNVGLLALALRFDARVRQATRNV